MTKQLKQWFCIKKMGDKVWYDVEAGSKKDIYQNFMAVNGALQTNKNRSIIIRPYDASKTKDWS